VTAISKFCKKNGALLVAKLRKFRDAGKYLIDRADLIIGEDNFFPHTALELFAISDVCFGFSTSGAYECVAAGTPYVDIHVPFFPKKEYLQCSTTTLEVNCDWEGVIYEMSADNAINQLPQKCLDDFTLNSKARTTYLKHFTSGIEGNRSAMMLDAIAFKLDQQNSQS